MEAAVNERCEPCEHLGDDLPAVSQAGTDFTPVCEFHETRSWSERAPERMDYEPPVGRAAEIRDMSSDKNMSSPTWVGGEAGHVPLGEARLQAVANLAKQERVEREKREERKEAERNMQAAAVAYDKAHQAHAAALAELERAQNLLAWRCGMRPEPR